MDSILSKYLVGGGDDGSETYGPMPMDPAKFVGPPLPDMPKQDDTEEEETASAPPSPIDNLIKTKALLAKSKGQAPVSPALNQTDMFSKLLGTGDDKALKDAQEQARMNRLITGLSRGAAQIGAAFNPRAHIKVDDAAYDQLSKDANSPVKDLQEQRTAESDAVKTATAKLALKNEMEMNSADSDVSKQNQMLLKKEAGELGIDVGDVSHMTAKNAKDLLSHMGTMATKEMQRQYLAQKSQESRIDKMNAHDKVVLDHAISTANVSRGRPDIQQALAGNLAVAKFNDIFDGYPDLNQVPPQKMPLIAMEAAKIAQGGVPGHAETEKMYPGSIEYKVREAWQKFNSNPVAGNAGPYLQQLQEYTNKVQSSNDKVLKNHADALVNSYKGLMTDKNNSELIKQQMYLDYGLNQAKPAKTAANAGIDPAVAAFAAKHNVSIETAQHIKDSREGK